MLPSYSIQIFNSLINAVEAGLLVYIAIQTHLNNQAVRDKQFTINARLDHIFDLLNKKIDEVNSPKKGKLKNGS